MSKGNIFQGVRLALTMLATAGLLVGCSAAGGNKKPTADEAAIVDPSAPAKPEDRYKVTAERAPFFRFSPQQASGADQQVKKETRVTLVSHLAGYSKVRLAAGDVGFMDSADLGHLSPKEISDEDALYAAQHAPPAALAPLNGGNIGNGGNYNPPPEAGQAQPLPLPDATPTSTPPPPSMFRY